MFYLRDLQRLRLQMKTLMVVTQVMSCGMEVGLPWMKKTYARTAANRQLAEETKTAAKKKTDAHTPDQEEDQEEKKEAVKEDKSEAQEAYWAEQQLVDAPALFYEYVDVPLPCA